MQELANPLFSHMNEVIMLRPSLEHSFHAPLGVAIDFAPLAIALSEAETYYMTSVKHELDQFIISRPSQQPVTSPVMTVARLNDINVL